MGFFALRGFISRLFRKPSRIRLGLIRSKRHVLRTIRTDNTLGHAHEVYVERIMGILRLGTDRPSKTRSCIVDTGSFLSIFPEEVWRSHESQIEWLGTTRPLPAWLSRITGLGGGEIGCEPGVVDIELVGLDGESLPLTRIVGLFATDGGRLRDVILGLDGYTYRGRALTIRYDQREVWIQVDPGR